MTNQPSRNFKLTMVSDQRSSSRSFGEHDPPVLASAFNGSGRGDGTDGFVTIDVGRSREESDRKADMKSERATQRMLTAFGSSKNGAVALTRVIRVTLEWRELTYSVVLGRGRRRSHKTVLQDVSAAMPPGRLLAVMGPTGCGKTSLVNALAGRLPAGGSLEGEILVNGIPRGRGFRTITAYVMQDDVLFHNLTVRETFEFAASMRLPRTIPPATKAALVTGIISELGLAKAQGTYIGNAFVRGVSGGERKRVNIGIEMLSNPSLIFLDEPTSGLDAFQAQNVMESLWSLAKGGRSVVATVHQPRSSIYTMFDLLLLLSEGRAVFFGHASEAVEWFAGCGFTCPAHFNPADFFLDIISADHRSPQAEKESGLRIETLAEKYGQQQEAEAAGVVAKAPFRVTRADSVAMAEVNDAPGFPNTLPVEFWLLLRRAWKQQSRDRMTQVVTLVQTVVIGFVLAALYSQMEMNQTGINDEIGILFFICIFSAMGAMFGSLTSFPVERGIINRERAGKAYHVLPYYLARFICDIPLRVGQGLLFGVIVYWIVGLNPAAGAFFIFVALLILVGLAAQGLGTAISAACKNEKIAMSVAPALTVILILFGGFYVNEDTIPAALSWIAYLSHLYWGFMGLAINDFKGREGWSCEGDIGLGCTTTGDQILTRLGFESNHLWQPFLYLSCLIVGFNTLGYVLLRFTKPKYLPLTPSKKKQ